MDFILESNDYITVGPIEDFIIYQVGLLNLDLVVNVDFQVEVMVVWAGADSTGFREGEMAITVAEEGMAVFIATRLAAGVFVNKNTMQTALKDYLDFNNDPAGESLIVSEKTDVFLNNEPLNSEGELDWWAENGLASVSTILKFEDDTPSELKDFIKTILPSLAQEDSGLAEIYSDAEVLVIHAKISSPDTYEWRVIIIVEPTPQRPTTGQELGTDLARYILKNEEVLQEVIDLFYGPNEYLVEQWSTSEEEGKIFVNAQNQVDQDIYDYDLSDNILEMGFSLSAPLPVGEGYPMVSF